MNHIVTKALKPIDNAPLVIFRMLFGLVFACESFGAIMTGWVRVNLVDVQMTFSHIYMDWLQPLPGYGMYYYFILMGLASLGVMLGYRYRLSIVLLTLLWAGVYYMQKTSYNNHYYLMLVICFYMCLVPANKYASLDVRAGRTQSELAMPAYYSWIFIFQIAVVYFYATLAKFYPDWLDGTFVHLLYSGINVPDYFKEIFTKPAFYITISYLGILYDGLIIPLLLWKRTRTLAVIASLAFHLFNSVTLHIGVFPYFALTFALFFYEPDQIRKRFFKKKPKLEKGAYGFTWDRKKMGLLIGFMVVQLVLPVRHHFIEGDVLWTDEGHRLSWRMMLRSRGGYSHFYVEDEKGHRERYPIEEVLTSKQQARVSSPDMIWQMAQRIRKEYEKRGEKVAVYCESWVSINNREYMPFVDETVDLGAVKWNYFGHNTWVLPEPF